MMGKILLRRAMLCCQDFIPWSRFGSMQRVECNKRGGGGERWHEVQKER